MAFWNREEVPDELKGIDPKEIAAQLKKAKELEDKLTVALADKTKSDEQLATLQAQLTTNEQKMQELEAKLNNPPPPPRKEGENEPTSIFADPDRFVDERTAGVRNAALLSGVMSAKMYARQELNARDQRIFKKYEGELDKIVSSYPPESRINPQIWHNALKYIKGEHMDDIRKAESEGGEFFGEISSPGTQRTTGEGEGGEVKLTDEENEVCEKFHWDKAKYLDNKKKASNYGNKHIIFGGANG